MEKLRAAMMGMNGHQQKLQRKGSIEPSDAEEQGTLSLSEAPQ